MADTNDVGAVPDGNISALLERIASNPENNKYGMRVLSTNPWLLVFDDFLTNIEVDELLSPFSDGWKRSTAGGLLGGDGLKGESRKDTQRTSEQIWCQGNCEREPGMDRALSRIEVMTGINRGRFEDTQVLRYSKGQQYGIHNDFIDGHRNQACGPRLLTFFMYLSDNPEAGTDFPKLNQTVKARKGRAALWPDVSASNMFEMERKTLHAGLPPATDNPKYSANVWIHQGEFKYYNDHRCLFLEREDFRYFRDPYVNVTFAPGAVGLHLRGDLVTKIEQGSQAQQKDVRVKWRFYTIDGLPFTADLLQEKKKGDTDYIVKFYRPPKRRRRDEL